MDRLKQSGWTLPLSIQDFGKKRNVTLDGNKSGEMADAYRNDATANALIKASGGPNLAFLDEIKRRK